MPSAISIIVFPLLPHLTTPTPSAPPPLLRGNLFAAPGERVVRPGVGPRDSKRRPHPCRLISLSKPHAFVQKPTDRLDAWRGISLQCSLGRKIGADSNYELPSRIHLFIHRWLST